MASSVPVVVLTHGTNECRDMIKVSVARTLEWCKLHDLDFRGSTRREAPDNHVFWDKVALIRRVFYAYPFGALGVWMDSDCIVAQIDVSPRDVLPEGFDIGMRKVIRKSSGQPWWNAGVIFMRNTAAFQLAMDAVWALRNEPESAHTDEWAFNTVLNDLGCFELPVAWNAMNKEDYAIIRGYHMWSHDRVIEKLADEKLVSTRRLKFTKGE